MRREYTGHNALTRMKTIFEHIEYVKGKPHHIRNRVALAASIFGAALITLVWFVGSISTGAFAIQGSNFADSSGRPSADIVGRPSADVAGIAGAAAAIPDTNAPAHIEIVDTSSSTKPIKKAEQTIIPF